MKKFLCALLSSAILVTAFPIASLAATVTVSGELDETTLSEEESADSDVMGTVTASSESQSSSPDVPLNPDSSPTPIEFPIPETGDERTIENVNAGDKVTIDCNVNEGYEVSKVTVSHGVEGDGNTIEVNPEDDDAGLLRWTFTMPEGNDEVFVKMLFGKVTPLPEPTTQPEPSPEPTTQPEPAPVPETPAAAEPQMAIAVDTNAEATPVFLNRASSFKKNYTYTVGIKGAESGALSDFKVHNVDSGTEANQQFLVDHYALRTMSKVSKIFSTVKLCSSVPLGEIGKKVTLSFSGFEKGKTQVIYAACYNSTLKEAYYLMGTLDTDGVVTFDNFILDNDTNITVFAIETISIDLVPLSLTLN